MVKRNILLNPGPATTTDTVKYAQVVPDICPREKEFGDLMESINKDLIKIAKGDKSNYACILFSGSGTAAMDATINSVVPPGKKILIINNGAYGERMTKIAKAYNIEFTELKFEWGTLPDLDKIEDVLINDPQIACVSAVHHETTFGILNPIKKIGLLTRKYDRTFIVDTISSFAGIYVNIKEFNIDFMMSTSNKCIQGIAGVCFIVCKKEKLEKIRDYPKRSFYLNLYDQYEYFKKNHQMIFTAPVQTMYALRKAIDELFEEGVENRYNRYTKNWELLRKGVTDLGFKILTKAEDESHILMSVLYPNDPHFDFNILHDKLYKKGYTIYPGKIGKMNTFRLANMGAIDSKDIKSFIKAFGEVIKDMRIRIQ